MSNDLANESSIPCSICYSTEKNTVWRATDLHLGMGGDEEFTYLECAHCGCVQIVNKPEDLSKYYPANYYSYRVDYPPKKNFRWYKSRLRARNVTGNVNLPSLLLGFIDRISKKKRINAALWCAVKAGVKPDESILDVGCGNGENLLSLAESGYRCLTGVDLFIEKDVSYPNVTIRKSSIYDLNDVSFDFISSHHSFEHMDDPLDAMHKLRSLLNPGKFLMIRMPVSDGYGWTHYKENWIGLEAPRHLMIHTRKSMELLAQKAGLVLDSVVKESSGSYLIESERRFRNVNTIDEQSKKQLRQLAKKLLAQGSGDVAAFFFKRPV